MLISKKSLRLIAVAGIILAVIMWFGSGVPNPLDITPSFEGLNAGVEGANQLDGIFVRIDQPFPNSNYVWVNSDPKSAILRQNFVLNQQAQVRMETGTPQLVTDPLLQGRRIHYWVRSSSSLFYEVDGQVNVYSVPITISASNLPLIDKWFQGEKIWFSLVGVTWNQAVQKVGADYGSAWEAPVYAVIEKYEVRDAGDHGKLDPSESGRPITIYDSTAQRGTIGDLGVLTGAVNATFVGNASPDSRLKQAGFFVITLTEFGTTDHGFWANSPVADYKLKVYTIQLGKYTYTNPDFTPWAERKTEGGSVFSPIANPFADWLANPFNVAGLAGFFIILILGLAALAFLWFFGLPRLKRGSG